MNQTDLFLVFLGAVSLVVGAGSCWSAIEASEVKPPEYYRVISVVSLVLAAFVASITGFNLLLGMYN